MATSDPMQFRHAAILAAKAADLRWCGDTRRYPHASPGRLAAIVDAVLAVANIENDDGADT